MIYKTMYVVKIKMVKDKKLSYGTKVQSPASIIGILTPFFKDLDREQFIVVGLNASNYPTVLNIVSIGCINATHVHASDVFKPLVLSNSVSFICAHNHPSGNLTPSNADLAITKRLKEAGNIMGFTLIDHLIVNDDNHFYSFNEHNQI